MTSADGKSAKQLTTFLIAQDIFVRRIAASKIPPRESANKTSDKLYAEASYAFDAARAFTAIAEVWEEELD